MNELTESQREAVKGLKMKTTLHLNMGDGGHLEQRCEQIGLTRIIRTPKKKGGGWGTGVVTWVSDSDRGTEHESLADALRCCGIM